MGIIGGADGPTAIFIGGDIWGLVIAACVLLAAIGAVVFFIVRKRKKETPDP